jgi:hypothetical protein
VLQFTLSTEIMLAIDIIKFVNAGCYNLLIKSAIDIIKFSKLKLIKHI